MVERVIDTKDTNLTFDEKSTILNTVLSIPIQNLFKETNEDHEIKPTKLIGLIEVNSTRIDVTREDLAKQFITNHWRRWEQEKNRPHSTTANYETLVEFVYDMINKVAKRNGNVRWLTSTPATNKEICPPKSNSNNDKASNKTPEKKAFNPLVDWTNDEFKVMNCMHLEGKTASETAGELGITQKEVVTLFNSAESKYCYTIKRRITAIAILEKASKLSIN